MIYLKSILAGIAGSILAIVLLVIAMIVLNVSGVFKEGMVGISAFIPLAIVALGFVSSFYLVFRTSRLRKTSRN